MSVAQIGPVYVPQAAQPAEESPAPKRFALPKPHPTYAGFWLRAVAYAIDSILLSVALAFAGSFDPSAFIVFPSANAAAPYALPELTPLAVGLIIPIIWLYYALFETSSWQATPGKRVLRLYVTDAKGAPLTFPRATIRHFAKILSGLTFLVGYFMAGFTEKKQALHDIIAGCLVLRRP